MNLSPHVQLGIVVGGLVAVAALLIADDVRQEFRRLEREQAAAAQRAVEEIPEPWPTPLPLETAKSTPEGYVFPARDSGWDPCGNGPIRQDSSGEEEAA